MADADWNVALMGDPDREMPVFLAIARTIVNDIRRGRLRPGTCMPGSRQAAADFGVHRNTMLAAYRECISEGWLITERARGTFVSPSLPIEAGVSKAAKKGSAGQTTPYELPPFEPLDLPPAAGSATMTLGGGVPDVRLFPAEALARAMRRAMRRSPLDVLSYGDPAGPPALRRAVAGMVAATRGVAASEENVLIVRGSQMAIDLVARTFLTAKDVVAVEALGYRPAWEALRGTGARLLPFNVDAGGLDVDALAASKEKLRGVYVTPHHQFPTTVMLDAARRLRLLELARTRGFWILEDDYDHEFHYAGRPVLPIASADAHGSVIYVGTFSKVLAPGLRMGFVVAPAPVIERLARTRRFVDRQGDHILAAAIAELIDDGEIQRHIRRARRVYGERRERTAKLLVESLGSALSFDLPNGGTAIWAAVDPSISVDEWARNAREKHDLLLQPAAHFTFDGPVDKARRGFFRLGFAQHDDVEAKEAIKRLKASMPRSSRS